jgi:hypothetical protein
LLGNFLEKLQHFEQENYEIAKLLSFEVSNFSKEFLMVGQHVIGSLKFLLVYLFLVRFG